MPLINKLVFLAKNNNKIKLKMIKIKYKMTKYQACKSKFLIL